MWNSLPQIRKPWVAAALSMVCCGLGQIYCGRGARGLAMYGVTLLFAPVVALATLMGGSTLWLFVLLASVLAVAAVYVGSVVDAQRLATRLAGQTFVPRNYNRRWVYWLLALTSLPITLGVVYCLRANVVEAYYIPSSSMAPTLVNGDRFLANKLDIGSRTFERGDVVVFRNPENHDQRFVKRIVGLPGDTVELRGGTVFINGQVLQREPVAGTQSTDHAAQPYFESNGGRRYQVLIGESDENSDVSQQTVPEDAYFVLGDHRGLSHDSRKFGAVARGEVVGLVTWLYGPAGSWQRFGVVE